MSDPKDDPKVWKAMLQKMAEHAREHPGTSGIPDSLKDGGPGDADCVATWLASCFYAGGQKVRLVGAKAEDGRGAFYVEVFHEGFPSAPKIMDMPPAVRGGFHPEYPNFQWVAVLPFHGWIHETADVLTWKRMAEVEL